MKRPPLAPVSMLLMCAGTVHAGSIPSFQDVRIVQSLPLPTSGPPIQLGQERMRLFAIDMNDDDAPDLVTWVAGFVTVQLNRGDATFDPAFTIASDTLDAGVGDFDDDAIPDVAVVTGASITLLHNDASAGFALAASLPITASRITITDINSDARADLIASNQLLTRLPAAFEFGGPVPSLVSPEFLPARLSPSSPDVDFIQLGDGSLLYSTGGGNMVAAGSATAPLPAIGLGDFDADSDDDVIRSASTMTGGGVRAVGINRNVGGVFQPQPNSERVRTDMMRSLALLGDFNGDTRTDVVAAPILEILNQQGPGRRFHAFAQTKSKELRLSATRAIGDYFPAAIATADFNADSIPDVAFACSGKSIDISIPGESPSSIRVGRTISIALGSTVQPFTSVPQDLMVMGGGARVTALELFDIDADKDLDIFATGVGNRLEARQNRGDGTFSDLSIFTTVPGQATSLRTLPVKKGQHLYAQSGASLVRLRFDPGAYPANCPQCAADYLPGIAISPEATFVPFGANADLDADNDIDAARVTRRGQTADTSEIGVTIQQKNAVLALSPVTISGRAHTVRIASFTADDFPDVIALTTSRAQVVLASPENSDGSETGGSSSPEPSIPGDFALEESIELLSNDANGNLTPIGRIVIMETIGNRRGFDVVVGDVNADQRDDLVVTIPSINTIAVLHGQPGGGFGARQDFVLPVTPNFDNEGSDAGPVLADIDADGDLDLVFLASMAPNTACASCADARVRFLLNDGNGAFNTLAVGPFVGFAQSFIRVGDINNDARPDVIVGGLHGVVVSQNITPPPPPRQSSPRSTGRSR